MYGHAACIRLWRASFYAPLVFKYLFIFHEGTAFRALQNLLMDHISLMKHLFARIIFEEASPTNTIHAIISAPAAFRFSLSPKFVCHQSGHVIKYLLSCRDDFDF